MRDFCVTRFLILALLLAVADASGAASRVLRIGTSGDYAPFSELEDGKRAGFDIAVAEAFARDSGREIEWVAFRWPELSGSLANDRFDLAMSGVTVRPERALEGRFSVPVARTGALLLIRDGLRAELAARAPNSTSPLAGLDVERLRIAVNRGGHLERVTRHHFRNAKILTVPDNLAVPDALRAGQVDAVVTDTLEAPHWLASLPGVAAVGPFTVDWKAYWISLGNEELAHELDSWLLDRERDGSLATLRARFFKDVRLPDSARPRSALVAAVDERLSLMPLVADAKRSEERPVIDPAREERVLAAALEAVERAAKAQGVSRPPNDAVLGFYRAQIDAAVEIQEHARTRPARPGARVYDLERELRPALLRIGDRIGELIVRFVQEGSGPVAEIETVDRFLGHHGLSPETLDALARSLETLAGARFRPDPRPR